MKPALKESQKYFMVGKTKSEQDIRTQLGEVNTVDEFCKYGKTM